MGPWPRGATISPWGQENHLVRGSLQHQEIPAERERWVSISQGREAQAKAKMASLRALAGGW